MSNLKIPYNLKEYNDGEWKEIIKNICIETKITLIINEKLIISLTCIPMQLEELAIGFLISEGLISDIKRIELIDVDDSNICISISNFKYNKKINEKIEIRTSGYIGLEQISIKPIEPLKANIKLDPKIIFVSQKLVNGKAEIWKETGGTHQAGIFNEKGKLLAYAEDCGRHNAIDKVIGKIYMENINPSQCFLVSTGRQSYNMVSKVGRAKIPMIISNTAPLSRGIDLARKIGIKLICFSREPKLCLY